MKLHTMYVSLLALAFGATAPLTLADEHDHDDHHHAGDMEVGIDGDGKLTVLFDFGEPIELPEVDGPVLFGFGGDDPGVIGLHDAEDGLQPLDHDARVQLELVAIDPGLTLYVEGFTPVGVGETVDLWEYDPDHAEYETHWHPTAWNIADGYDPYVGYALSFRLIDVGDEAGYTPAAQSDVYTAVFTPEPTSAVALLAGALLLRRRR